MTFIPCAIPHFLPFAGSVLTSALMKSMNSIGDSTLPWQTPVLKVDLFVGNNSNLSVAVPEQPGERLAARSETDKNN